MRLFEKIKNLIDQNLFLSEAEFNDLALELYSHQFQNNSVYRRICVSKGFDEVLHDWKRIPLVSTELYKTVNLFCHQLERADKVFVSSGTTQNNKSHHYLSERELQLYELSLWKSFSKAFCLEENLSKNFDYIVLTETPQEKPNSSLIHMFECIRQKIGAAPNCYFVKDSVVQTQELLKKLEENIELQKPVLIVGTAFAFAQFLQELLYKQSQIKLPEGSVLMETGGFKGKTKELPKADFYEQIEEVLCLPQTSIVGQYGMSELNSQFYDSCFRLQSSSQETRWKQAPPWCRVRIIDPADPKEEVKENETGLIAFYDLSNLDSCGFILTGDLGIKRPGGRFDLVGRAANLLPKGCSLNYEI